MVKTIKTPQPLNSKKNANFTKQVSTFVDLALYMGIYADQYDRCTYATYFCIPMSN
jgi:hypothetical protein